MKHIMHILMLSCLKATELIEKKFHIKLSFTERLQLRMHTMMCDKCARYEKQSEFLENGIQHLANAHTHTADLDKLKLKIKEELSHRD